MSGNSSSWTSPQTMLQKGHSHKAKYAERHPMTGASQQWWHTTPMTPRMGGTACLAYSGNAGHNQEKKKKKKGGGERGETGKM